MNARRLAASWEKPRSIQPYAICVIGISIVLISSLPCMALRRDLAEGDECVMHDGSEGICAKAETCGSFLELYKEKRTNERVHCSWDGSSEIVCCSTLSSTAPPDIRKWDIGARAKEFCDTRISVNNFYTAHIFGGQEAEEGEFPFMASLGYEKIDNQPGYDYRCGASLIATNFLLTAAHCLRFGDPVVVLINTLNITRSDRGVRVGIKNISRHFGFGRGGRRYNDIALVELDRHMDAEMDDVKPICLYTDTETLAQDVVLSAVGFGRTEETDQDFSEILMKVNLTTVSLEDCNNTYSVAAPFSTNVRIPNGLQHNQYCAIGTRNVDTGIVGDTCQGDSGGALLITVDDKYYQIGITSLSVVCGSTTPALYTRVAAYVDWIESIVWPDGVV